MKGVGSPRLAKKSVRRGISADPLKQRATPQRMVLKLAALAIAVNRIISRAKFVDASDFTPVLHVDLLDHGLEQRFLRLGRHFFEQLLEQGKHLDTLVSYTYFFSISSIL